ncbi:class I SAM-dependent methyltransferase [Oceaniglobus ichthyenteri]|uniref:class I SAM-dependent methyltransferase n=1 Tax=Oceaniglobus ichthyenteri TaxID=2136177 RepID=UPI000D39A4E0|nr:class I SAM-dependent methyltransferase [Oceaniglobus ichthyenteri]
MLHRNNQRFWNRIAERYAARPLKNVPAYEAMLADVAARLKPTDRVLEIGCGTGGTAIALAPGVAHWTATDFSSEMIRIAQAKPAPKNLTFTVSDAATACDGGPFDAICAFNVLHLVDDLPATLGQIHKNLQPGGQMISKTWCFADMKLSLRALFPALRAVGLFPAAKSLSEGQLGQAILDAGFEIVEQRLFGDYRQNPYIVARKQPEP